MLAVLVAMVVRVTTSVSIISVVTPHREDRDELPPLSTGHLVSPGQPALSHSRSHLSCLRQGFYSQLNISTENLIRICKSLPHDQFNN